MITYRMLLPRAADEVDGEELLASMQPAADPPGDRPYTRVNFVASADGRATLGGLSGGLGDEGDRVIFHGLREHADAVLAGTGTMATEHYGRILGKPERRERRRARGLAPEPLACVISRRGELPLEAPLFAEPEARVAVFTAREPDLSSVRAQVQVTRLDPGELTLTTVMRTLYAEHGVRTLLCEGGPTLFGGLLHEDLVDELFLTVAPKLAGGGSGLTITHGPELVEPVPLRLEWLLERRESLFLRYSLR